MVGGSPRAASAGGQLPGGVNPGPRPRDGRGLHCRSMERLHLSSYACLESRHGTVVHVVGGAHVLPSSVIEVQRATKLASEHPRFAGVLLEMCGERAKSLEALVAAPPDSPPPILPSLWDGIKGSGPMVVVHLYYAAAEALLRGRIGQEQAAAARIASRLQTNILLVDRPMTATGLRVAASGLLWINPFLSTELAEAFRSRSVGPLGPLGATSISVAERLREQRRKTDSAASSPEAAAEAARAKAADGRRRMKDMFMLTRAPNARAATEEEIRAVMRDGREYVGGMVASGLDSSESGGVRWRKMRSAAFRAVEEPLLHERDVWLAHAFRSVQRRAPHGSHVVAVVGSGHVEGVVARWSEMEAFVALGRRGDAELSEGERERALDAWVNRLADVDVAAAIVQSSARHAIGLLLASSASGFLFARAVLPPLWRRRYAGFVGVASVLGTLNSAYQINTHWNGVRVLQQRWHAEFDRARGRA